MWAYKSTCIIKYVMASDNWYQAFILSVSPRLQDKSSDGKDWEQGYLSRGSFRNSMKVWGGGGGGGDSRMLLT